MGAASPFVTSVTTRIGRRAADYASMIDKQEATEPELLERLARNTDALLSNLSEHMQELPPYQSGRSRGLLFEHIYATLPRPADEAAGQTPSALFAALLAAEAEFLGPLRLGERQSARLAEVYEELGTHFAELPRHAILAFQRAKALYRIIEDTDGQDRCGQALAQARTRTARGWRRAIGLFSDVVCGYGYRPFRLLGWVLAELAVFIAAGLLVTGASFGDAIYMCVTCFLNPLGPGDLASLHRAARPLFAVESWAGAVSMSVFFALLVRKWFRL